MLSPRRRTLIRDGRELPLIPRYFDLLVFLVERRGQAVHRRDIFDHVWRDVVVSDSALSQAIRTIRRALDDDSREPRFVRTVSRHGYRFVFEDVIEEEEDEGITPVTTRADEAVSTVGPESVAAGQPTAAGTAAPGGKIALPGLEQPLWMRGAIGGGCAGLIAGGVGALLLASVPDSRASMAVVPVLALLGGGCGAAGAAGVMSGVSLAERVPGSARTGAIAIAGAALGGAIAGGAAQLLGHWTLQAIVGLDVQVGGLLQGLAIGAACGAAHRLTNTTDPSRDVQPQSPRRARPTKIATFAALCGLTALTLVLAGFPLVGGTLHAISEAASGAQTTLAPLGRLLGEQDFGPLTAAIIGTGEGLLFGAGLGTAISRSIDYSPHPQTTTA